ncbi:hypothetical protein LAT59_00420 [Candidatus Gracilibacteria bacterium]|nr:hypothetical protein [Candidatus Gracilibacteria bacterium]
MIFVIQIIYGILLITGGYYLIKYRRTVKSWTGNWYWAEKYIGNGGTYFVLILIGLGMMFFGVLYPFGGLEIIFGPGINPPSTP